MDSVKDYAENNTPVGANAPWSQPCMFLFMAKEFQRQYVLINIFPCSGLTVCSLACNLGWESKNVSLGVSAVPSEGYKARKSR